MEIVDGDVAMHSEDHVGEGTSTSVAEIPDPSAVAREGDSREGEIGEIEEVGGMEEVEEVGEVGEVEEVGGKQLMMVVRQFSGLRDSIHQS